MNNASLMDRILINDLVVRVIIGLHEWERRERQPVVVNAVLELELDEAARTDKIGESIDYGAVARQLAVHAESTRFRLLEALAGSLADLTLSEFAVVRAVTIRVDKPGALRFAKSAAVELRRNR